MASWTSGFDKRTRSPPPDRYRYYAEPDYSDYKGRDSGDRRRYSDFPLHRGFDDKRAFPRSPSRDAYDDRLLKRKRSVSPPNRYVRPRYDEGYRGRSPGRRYSPEPRSRGPPDPILADNPVSFRNFIEWFKYKYPTEFYDDEQERLKQPQAVPPEDGAEGKEPSSSPAKKPLVKVRYDEYRKRFMKKQYKTMFEYHRRLAWFIEKYDPAERYEDLRARVRREGMNGTIDQFILELEAGKHDPGQSPCQAIDTDDAAPTTQEIQDDDDTMGGEEEPTKQNTNAANEQPTKPVNPGEISIMPSGPQLMIRTIPPDIGRIKLEQVFQPLSGFKYIAIGDPVQKRQFYRSGWVAFEFEEDVKRALTELESKKIDNFKLPLTHITEPFVTKIRYTPACASKPERLEKDLEQAKKLIAVYESQAAQLAGYKPVWPIGAPADAPVPEQENGLTTEDEDDEERNPNRGSTTVEERIDRLVSERCDTDEDGNPLGNKKIEIALDLYLAYLREAFHVCYYCAVVTDHPEELIRKCAKHERRTEGQEIPTPAEGGEKDKEKGRKQDGPSDERWAEILDGKIACLIDRLAVDPTDYGGTRYDDDVSAMVADWVKQEDENRWRCTECKKLFKAGSFVEKHVINKHPEHFKGKLDEWEFYNNFVLDPQRITPMLAVPVSMNGTTHHPPQAFGLPSSWKPDVQRYDGRLDPLHPRSSMNGGSSHSYHDMLRPMRRSPSPPPPTFLPPRRMTMSMFESSNTPLSNGGGGAPSSLPVIPGLPAKPTDALGTSATASGMSLARRMSAAPAPPPPGAKQDPRARVSYHDLDSVDASEDVALQY